MSVNAPSLEEQPLSPLEYYSLVRERIEHEDNLVVQRLSWLVASQSFLFTAYAIVTNGLATQPPVISPHFMEQLTLLFRLVPIVGALTCVLIYISILAAIVSMNRLRDSYRSRFGNEDRVLPPIMTQPTIRYLGHSASILLPLVFITVWLVLSIQQLT